MNEIVVAAGDGESIYEDIRVYSQSGILLDSWDAFNDEALGDESSYVADLVCLDIDNDNKDEIIVCSRDNIGTTTDSKLYCLDENLNSQWSYPYYVRHMNVIDYDNDSSSEILCAALQYPTAGHSWGMLALETYGAVAWHTELEDIIWDFDIGNVDKELEDEIICAGDYGKLYSLSLNGQLEFTYDTNLGYATNSLSISTGDLNNDGIDEIVIGIMNHGDNNGIRAYRMNNPPSGSFSSVPAVIGSTQDISWTITDSDYDSLSISLYIKKLLDNSITALLEDSTEKTYTFDTSSFQDGEYLFILNVSDGYCEVKIESSSFIIDNTCPTISVNGITDGGSYSKTVTVTVSAADTNGINSIIIYENATQVAKADDEFITYYMDTTVYPHGTAVEFTVEATDSSGNTKSESYTLYVIDAQVPSASTNLSNGTVINCDYEIAYDFSDVSGITSVVIYLNDKLVDEKNYDDTPTSITGTYILPTNAYDDGEHILKMVITDSNINSKILYYSLIFDNTAPALNVIGVKNGTEYQQSLSIYIESSDIHKIAEIIVLFDLVIISNTTVNATSTSISVSVNLTEYSDGNHTIIIETKDELGNKNSKLFVIKNKDETVPTLTIDGITDGETLSGVLTIVVITFDASGILAVTMTVDGEITVSPDNYYLNGTEWVYIFKWDTKTITDGEHTLEFTSTDFVNNQNTKYFAIKTNNSNEAPSVTINSPIEGQIIDDSVTLKWIGTDPDEDTLTYVLYYSNDAGVTWTVLVSAISVTQYIWDTSEIPEGINYAIKIIAFDGELNSEPAIIGGLHIVHPNDSKSPAPVLVILSSIFIIALLKIRRRKHIG